MDASVKSAQWDVAWRDRQGSLRTFSFELDSGFCYRVICRDEADKERFLQTFLRPPETALLVADGGLLGNIKVDENVLLPLGCRGITMSEIDARVLALFAQCGYDAAQTQLILHRLPHQLSEYQKRVVGLVRAVLLQPRVMVYASIWHGVEQAELEKIFAFDEIVHRDMPSCTRVFVDYDTALNIASPLRQTFYL